MTKKDKLINIKVTEKKRDQIRSKACRLTGCNVSALVELAVDNFKPTNSELVKMMSNLENEKREARQKRKQTNKVKK